MAENEETQTATEEEETAQVETEEVSGDDTPAEEPEKKSGFQKRIDELTAKWRDAQRDTEYWKAKATEAPKAPEPEKAQPGRPVVEDFDDYDAYIEALTDFKVSQAEDKIIQKFESKTRKKTIAQKLKSFHDAGAEVHEDFSSVVENAVISETMRDVLLEIDHGTDVCYYLGKHRAESERIANLPSHLAAAELGKLELKLTNKPATPGRKPVNPLKSVQGEGGTGVTTVPDLNKPIPYDEWERLAALESG